MQKRRHTDTPLHDPGTKPRKAISDRWLKTVFGSALWFTTAAIVLGASFIDGVEPANANFWRLVICAPAVILGFVNLYVGSRISERVFQFWIEMNMIPALAVNLILLQITPATQLVLFNMIITIIFAGYFIRPIALSLTLAGAVGISLSALFTDPASQSPQIASFLVVYIPTMLITALLLHLQNSETTVALGNARTRAMTDPLTGLANLRGIQRAAARRLVPRPNSKSTDVVGLLLIDLNDFRSANTKHGHLGGDYVLRMVAQQMKRVEPKSAVTARLGGDEFAVLVRADSTERVVELGEIYCGAVRAAGSILELPGVELDAAIGTAIYPADGRDLWELLDAADKSKSEQKGEKLRAAVSPAPAPQYADEQPPWLETSREDEAQREPLSLDGLTGKHIPALASRSLYARTSTLAYAIGSILLGVSLLMPDAYPNPIMPAWLILVGGLTISAGIFLFNPKAQTKVHIGFDLFALFGFGVLIALTGGFESTAIPLLFMLVASQAWFWQTKMVMLRVVGPVLVACSPLLYTTAADHTGAVLNWLTVYAEAAVIATLVGGMYFNRWLLTQLQERAEKLATIDPLTGVLNRRAFDARVLALLEPECDVEQFAIVMIDLDNFKQVNAAHGHRAGDHVLVAIAQSLLDVARDDDCIARIGGDEFAAVLPGVGVEGARSLAERFVAAVAATPEAHGASLSASVGFALNPVHGNSLDQLVFSAGGALTSVKTSGKGSARVARVISAV